MTEKKRTLLDAIKDDIAKQGSSRAYQEIFKLREAGAKKRVRFLDSFNDGMGIRMHSEWNGYNHPCLKYKKQDCPHCDGPTQTVYVWNAYDYEEGKVVLITGKSNRASIVPGLVAVEEDLGDITDQDIIITRNGTGTSTTYTLMPTGKVKPFGKKVKPFSKNEIMKIFFEAFNNFGDDDNIDEEDFDEEEYEPEEKPRKKSSVKKTKSSTKKRKPEPEPEPDDDDDWDDDDWDEDDDDDEFEFDD